MSPTLIHYYIIHFNLLSCLYTTFHSISEKHGSQYLPYTYLIAQFQYTNSFRIMNSQSQLKTLLSIWESASGLPRWCSGKESACQGRRCKRRGFDFLLGKTPWGRKWQPTPVCLSGESPWTEEPGGLQSMGSQRVRHDWGDKQILTPATMFAFYICNSIFICRYTH